MAMKIGTTYKFGAVQARHWEQLAEVVSLTKAQTKRRRNWQNHCQPRRASSNPTLNEALLGME